MANEQTEAVTEVVDPIVHSGGVKMREPNTPAQFGHIALITMVGPQPDEHDFGLTVNQATDGQLVDALATRGYDVKVTVPSEKAMERRKRQREARLARKAKRAAALAKAEARR